jgi:hypothetical protein
LILISRQSLIFFNFVLTKDISHSTKWHAFLPPLTPQQDYISAVRKTLHSVLCLRDFPSELVEKHNKPEIEMHDHDKSNRWLCIKPILISRKDKRNYEKCLIEASINSVRVSFRIQQNDQMETLITGKMAKFLASRANFFEIFRKKPIEVTVPILALGVRYLLPGNKLPHERVRQR